MKSSRWLYALFAIGGLSTAAILSVGGSVYAALSCTVSGSCLDTTIFKMSGTTNAHAELAAGVLYSQSVCCSGVVGLTNLCLGNYAVALKLSGIINAHVEQNTQSNYANDVCISVPTGSVTIAYQANNCTGYDTTIASVSGTTNAHVGDANAYTTKVCGTASTASGTFTVTASSSNSFNAPLTVQFTSQTSTISNLGAVKIIDDRVTMPGWTLAAAGNDWKSGQDVMQLDYDGTGSNGNLGKLCLFPNSGTLYAESGSTTGVTKGSNQCFSASASSINLVTASNSNGHGTYWLTDWPAEQFFPSSPTPASYTTTIVYTLSQAPSRRLADGG